MSYRWCVLVVAVCCCFVPFRANAQLQMYVLNNGNAQPSGTVYDFGNVSSGNSLSVHFRLRNTSTNSFTVTTLAVAGAGFILSGGPSLPDGLGSQGTADFVVTFQAMVIGGYSATLSSDGLSVLLTATVVPGLTYFLQTSSGNQALSATPVDFGTVSTGQTQMRHFIINNSTQQALPVPTVTVSQSDFGLSGTSPAGTMLQPGKQAGFDVLFKPTAGGVRTGTLSIGGSSYSLTGTGLAPPSPKPQITVTLPQPQSMQQGSLVVTFASPAAAAGSGVVNLQFQPSTSATDSTVVFASGGQSAPFTYTAGDTQATFGTQRSAAFQTGTTAGVITFSVQLSSGSDQQSVTVPPASVTITAVQSARNPSNVQVTLTGFDNTRTVGKMTFTFYDAYGDLIGTGPISADATSAFSQYFAGSVLGGTFKVQAVFPVSGDVSSITYVQATFANSVGTSTTQRTSF